MLTRKQILQANKNGLKYGKEEGAWYYTAVLICAYNLGANGVDLTNAPDVSGYRYGKAPWDFISYNYRDDVAELGLSMACLDGEKPVGSSMWFSVRKEYRYSGMLAGRGSDGEALILCYDAELLD